MNRSWNLGIASQIPKNERTQASPASGDETLKPLEKGSKAKLIFNFTSEEPGTPRAEHLWIEILLVQHDDKLLGQLEDNPVYIRDLKRGEIIEFEERNIIETD